LLVVLFDYLAAGILELKSYRAVFVELIANESLAPGYFIGELKRFGRCLFKPDDFSPSHRRQSRSWALCPRLRVDLSVALDHLAIKPAIDIRILLCRMVVVLALWIFVSIEPIERLFILFVLVSEDGVSIECIGNRLSLADERFEMDRCDVVMVVIRSTAVSTPLV
jgi:hypothetical protein